MSVIPIGFLSASAAQEGKIGECKWKLDGTVLTISGNGSMDQFDGDRCPWGTDITEVIVKEGVTEIGSCAFMDCKYLRKVTLPSTLLSIMTGAFLGCQALEEITIPESVKKLGYDVFFNCWKLTEIFIPKNVVDIGVQTFDSCYDLKKIIVDPENKSYTSVDGVLFNKDMTELIKYPQAKAVSYSPSYTVPETVKTICFHAFEGASNLSYIDLPDGIESIDSAAFYRTAVYWDAVRSGEDIFYIDEYLIEVIDKEKGGYEIKEGTRLIAGGAFSFCSKVKRLVVPDGVEYIGESAFWACRSLKEISLPQSLKAIELWAFIDTPLETVYYRGTKTERNRIKIPSDNKELKGATWYLEACYKSDKHSWGEDVTVLSATCVDDGVLESECTVCGKVSEAKVSALGHTYDVYSQEKAPTCVSVGTEIAICSVCGDKDERYVEPTGHSYGTFSQEKAATCVSVGIEVSTCSLCGDRDEREIQPTGHTFNSWKVEEAASCTDIGIEKRKCAMCDTVEAREVAATGHDFGEFVTVKESTVSEEGYMVAECRNCDESKTEIISRLELKDAISIWHVLAVAFGCVALAAIIVMVVVIKRVKKTKSE